MAGQNLEVCDQLASLQREHTSLKEAHQLLQKEHTECQHYLNQLKCNFEALKVGGWGLFHYNQRARHTAS